MKTDKNFIWLSLASFVFTFGVNFSAPFYIVYNTSEAFYSLSIFETAILSSIGFVPQIIFSFLTIKFIEKLRTKEVLIIGSILTSLFPIIFLIPYWIGMSTNVYLVLIILWVINGMFWGIISPSMMTLTLDVIHPRRRMLQLAIFNSLNSIALFIAPILGGLAIPESVIKGESSASFVIFLIFIISAGFRLLGGLLFIKVQEPIIGGTILRPINKILRYPIRANIERSISAIVATPSKIMHRRKSKKYGKSNE
jgi:MFS family permease